MPGGERQPGLLPILAEDLRTIVERDPSVRTRSEALLHPALPAVWMHRVAHPLYRRGRRLLAKALMLLARGVTGVEIHPGAVLGRRVFVDHGAAVVVGETAVVGDDVTIYHQVTLGAVGWWRDNRRADGERRHPVIGARVVLGVGASVLGPVHVGDDAIVGAGTLILGDVPAGARALAPLGAVSPRKTTLSDTDPVPGAESPSGADPVRGADLVSSAEPLPIADPVRGADQVPGAEPPAVVPEPAGRGGTAGPRIPLGPLAPLAIPAPWEAPLAGLTRSRPQGPESGGDRPPARSSQSRPTDERNGSMNPDSTVLIVGATDETVRKAKELGLTILLLQHPSKVNAEQEELADILHVVDYTDWAAVEPIARQLRVEPGFRVAVSITEPGLENAGRINDLFGLEGTGYQVTRLLRDKLAMRRYLAERDPSAVAAAPLLLREDLDSFGALHGYPFIVKPTDATASIGVFRVDGPEDAAEVWATVEGLRGTRTDRISTMYLLQDFLIEEYVEGPEYSVEAFSFAGRHVVVAVTEKFVHADRFAELGHALPARLEEGVRDQIRARVASFLDLIGLRDGVTHTELRIGPRGPMIIESHNRIAGDAIPELVRGAYGIDMTEYALGWPFGLVPELPDRPKAHAGASVRFLVSEAGRVESVEGGPDAAAQDGVLDVRITAKPGDRVHSLRDNWDRLGLVAVTGADTTAAIRRGAEVIEDNIRIRVTGADGRTWLARVAETGTPAGVRA
ncbi:ATP-grasp domain-containing protein [Sphaerisporangium corydalis]|uniref:serine O-acetyltransferase n=1 Tax=Sphaerisporangium corydalis TaxID=1441875 RepID=A0ABV9EJL4_9ACTN|nr:ATP-grasp domain-containing protein [Sphaerisporangium corydalis]